MKSAKKIRCLVIQLSTMSDTLQSLMALRAAQQLYPEIEIHFVARHRFAEAALRTPWLASVHALPDNEFPGTEQEALPALAQWVAPLVQDRWDIILNWSFSEASSFLTGLLPADLKLGYSRRADLSFSAEDGWSHYIQAIVQSQTQQNIHLTDILTTQLLTALQIKFGDPVDPGNAAVTSKSFFSLRKIDEPLWADSRRRLIACQLGANFNDKPWSDENWVDFLTYLLDRHPDACVVLLGKESQRLHAATILREIQTDPERLISLVGETDFDLWTTIIARSQWLISCDNTALQLASVLGTRIFNISSNNSHFEETGPYGNGHYIVTSANNDDAVISPEACYAIWAYAASEWAHQRQLGIENHFTQLGWGSELAKIRVYRSQIRPADAGGGVVFEPLIKRTLRVSDWTAAMLGHVARSWYCGWAPPIGHELQRELISPTLIQAIRQIDEAASALAQICKEGQNTANELAQKSGQIKSPRLMAVQDREAITLMGRKLAELDQLIERLGKAHEVITPFARMSKVLMHNLPGNELDEIGKQSAAAYSQIYDGANMIRDWAKHTLNLAKPVPLEHTAKILPLTKRSGPPLC